MNSQDIEKQLDSQISYMQNCDKNSTSKELELQSNISYKEGQNKDLESISSQTAINQPLLATESRKMNQYPKESCSQSLSRLLVGPSIQTSDRKITLYNQQVQPANYCPNIVRNQRHTLLTFVPVVLYNQFKFFFNFFFLLTSISQFFPCLQVGFLISYLSPLIFVLTLSMLKEGYDDWQRYKRDREANSALYTVISQKGRQLMTSSQLQVGMVVEINANQKIPADLVLLHTQDKSASIFIRTDQLDGETDWKLRKSIRVTQNAIDKLIQNKTGYAGLSLSQLSPVLVDSSIKCMAPSQQIYHFQGVFKQGKQPNKIQEALGLEHTLWANTVLASSKVLGVVMYSGKETRMQMNNSTSRNKFGQLEQEINYVTKLLFLYLVMICVIMCILKGGEITSNTFVVFLRYVLLISSLIPISMRVNLDFAKLLYCYRINKDDKIKGTVARNSNIPEELGRIKYLLSDKTGTLTQNDMIFKRLSLEQIQFSHEDQEDIKKMIEKNTKKYTTGLMEDINIKRQSQEIPIEMSSKESINNSIVSGGIFQNKKTMKRDKESLVRDCINALALCHNVTPVVDEQTGEKTFQASSPDEIALVKTAEEMGVTLKSRNEQQITLINATGAEEVYQILAIFPFTSESKRMGIVIQQNNKIIFLLKGADTVMKSKVPEVQRGFLQDECEDLSSEGLRTLCFAYRWLEVEEYETWNKEYQVAQLDLKQRKQKIEECLMSLERNMQFLCITGVEDKLQDKVSQTIENLRNAGCAIWMLTGDKVETAQCIAISAGLRNDPSQNMFLIKEVEDQLELRNKLNDFSSKDNNDILVIDGDSLRTALAEFPQHFIETSRQAPAVVCCRCSPTQKSEITLCLKKYTGERVAAIGDGGNDVGMIQSADVGIGVVGKEGKQAALAADFSILQFSYLSRLMLWHGRHSYKRSATLSQFVIHRGLIISTIQTVFICVFYFVTMSIYNGMLNLGYSTIFTNLPIFCLIFDQDVNEETALGFPPLYETLQKGRDLNLKTFLGWCFKSLYQGTIIMIMGIYMYQDNYFVNMVTITFSCLILTEFLNVYSELHSVHVVMIVCQVLSVVVYFLAIICMPSMFDVATMDGEFLWKMIVVTLASWLPFHLFKVAKSIIDPSDYERMMKGVKKKILNKI